MSKLKQKDIEVLKKEFRKKAEQQAQYEPKWKKEEELFPSEIRDTFQIEVPSRFFVEMTKNKAENSVWARPDKGFIQLREKAKNLTEGEIINNISFWLCRAKEDISYMGVEIPKGTPRIYAFVN